MELPMIVEGSVTNVFDKILAFEVNNSIMVYMGLICQTKSNQNLPKLHSPIKVTSTSGNYIWDTKQKALIVVVLTEVSQIEGIFEIARNERNFLQLSFKQSLEDTLRLAQIFHRVSKELGRFPAEELLYTIIEKLSTLNFQLEFVSDIHCARGRPQGIDSVEYYSPLINRSIFDKHKKCLYGIFKFCSELGCLKLSSNNESIITYILNDFDNFFTLDLTHVLIKDYMVLGELYNVKKNESVFMSYSECLIIDAKSIILLNQPPDLPAALRCPLNVNEYKSFCFTVLCKIPLLYDKGGVQFLLEVTSPDGVTLLNVPPHFYSRAETLNTYTIFYKNFICQGDTSSGKFYRRHLIIDKTMFLVPSQKKTIKREIQTPTQAFAKMKICPNQRTINFEGVIHGKAFHQNQTVSRFAGLPEKFGTHGDGRVPVLHFLKNDRSELKLYLNDWKERFSPLGLTPNTRIRAYNVVSCPNPRQGGYLKSCLYTAFEIVSHESSNGFQSVRLGCSSWGPFVLLSNSSISQSSIVCGKIRKITISELQFGKAKIKGFDVEGEFDIFANSETAVKLLKILLRAEDVVFTRIKDRIISLGNEGFCYIYTSNGHELRYERTIVERHGFFSRLTRILNHYKTQECCIKVLVRRLYSSNVPSYHLLDCAT